MFVYIFISSRKNFDILDTSVAVPLFKKDNKKLHEKYIFMGNVVSKLFCKVLKFGLRDWLDKEEILSPVQAGFRSTFITVDYIFTLEILRRKFVAIYLAIDKFVTNSDYLWLF